LILNDIAMVMADTSRSKCYIKELIKYDLIPKYILLLINSKSEVLPGQENSNLDIISMFKSNNIQYEISSDSNVNSNKVVSKISNRTESVFIFSGFGGVLLQDSILSTGKKFLHVHGGYLPNYKGSTTNYYSLINENIIGASSIFLTQNIDCGPVLVRRKFKPPINRVEMDHVYDSEVRSKVLIETLKKYIKYGSWDFELECNDGGEVFYIIHPVLKHLAILGE
jgi:methionyl-tRNA formyltransferase